jgi:hypothetical protein
VRLLVESGANANATDQYGAGTLLAFHPEVIYDHCCGMAPTPMQCSRRNLTSAARCCSTLDMQPKLHKFIQVVHETSV